MDSLKLGLGVLLKVHNYFHFLCLYLLYSFVVEGYSNAHLTVKYFFIFPHWLFRHKVQVNYFALYQSNILTYLFLFMYKSLIEHYLHLTSFFSNSTKKKSTFIKVFSKIDKLFGEKYEIFRLLFVCSKNMHCLLFDYFVFLSKFKLTLKILTGDNFFHYLTYEHTYNLCVLFISPLYLATLWPNAIKIVTTSIWRIP